MESSAWLVQVKPAEAKVEVSAAPQLVGVRVVANRNELFPREKISLRAQGRFSDNAEKYLSSGIQWETSDGTVASIGPGGELEALRPGKVQVVALLFGRRFLRLDRQLSRFLHVFGPAAGALRYLHLDRIGSGGGRIRQTPLGRRGKISGK